MLTLRGIPNAMSDQRLTRQDLEAQSAVALPDKEAMSLLDVNAELDLALDLAAPIDAAVAANANVAAPIDAAVSANLLSVGSSSTALADQDVAILQQLDGTAEATADQTATIGQGDDGATEDGTTLPEDEAVQEGSLLDGLEGGSLLSVNADLAIDADIAAPVTAAVAANANVAAPIDAAVSANIGSIASESVAIADQDAVIVQQLEGEVVADATQDSAIEQ